MRSNRWHIWATVPGAAAAQVTKWFPPLAGRPLALTERMSTAEVVRYLSSEAYSVGVAHGMPVEEALGLCPALTTMPVPLGAAQALVKGMADSLDLSGTMCRPDEFSLSFRGPGSPESILSRLDEWFSVRLKMRCQAAAAATPEAARIAAAALDLVPPVVSPGSEADTLSPIPLHRLPWLSRDGVLGLAREWAVFSLGDLAHMPGGLVWKLLGREGVAVHRLVGGRAKPNTAAITVCVTLSEPANHTATVRGALLRGIDVAWGRLAAMGGATRKLEICLKRRGGRSVTAASYFDPELEDPISLGHAAALLLQRLLTRRAMAAVEVHLFPGAPAGTQLPLFPDLGTFRLSRLGHAISSLDARFGAGVVTRASSLGCERALSPHQLLVPAISHPPSSLREYSSKSMDLLEYSY